MGKPSDLQKAVAAGRHSCVVNEPEWGDSDIAESDDGMEVSQGSERSREKRGDGFAGIKSKGQA